MNFQSAHSNLYFQYLVNWNLCWILGCLHLLSWMNQFVFIFHLYFCRMDFSDSRWYCTSEFFKYFELYFSLISFHHLFQIRLLLYLFYHFYLYFSLKFYLFIFMENYIHIQFFIFLVSIVNYLDKFDCTNYF